MIQQRIVNDLISVPYVTTMSREWTTCPNVLSHIWNDLLSRRGPGTGATSV